MYISVILQVLITLHKLFSWYLGWLNLIACVIVEPQPTSSVVN